MARFDRLTVFNTLYADGLVPLYYTPDPAAALKVVRATFAGGCRTFEFTNRGDFAIEVFSQLIKAAAVECPGLILGVGSVDDAPTAALYIAHGANFVVGPSFSADTARLCNRRKIGYVPGCGSVTEIATAEEHGAELIKVFPGNSVGGPGFIKAVMAPRPWTRLMPTGGVSSDEANLKEWFGAGAAAVGMGSNLIKDETVKAGDFETITRLTAEALAMVKKVRGR
ncbi:MAG: bifunctional 4-hydroxy-2-oxoglutarate aldolase/2-dehydro-3-deoxy-phosphogluconate aldolase [Chloroflexi bacterium]|nr:bifunctional 4-hydroxy-2-oxoglutarate aldolase/2-dehydro-3-deoxy-phosphogluconate aldolase [Chloroflexota bacterium]